MQVHLEFSLELVAKEQGALFQELVGQIIAKLIFLLIEKFQQPPKIAQ